MRDNKMIEAILRFSLLMILIFGNGMCKLINAVFCTDFYIDAC